MGQLYDYGARFYSPLLGRFTSADSIVPQPGNPQSLNRYAYTLNNPLIRIDPTGHTDEPWWKKTICQMFPIACQPSPNFMPAVEGVLSVNKTEPIAITGQAGIFDLSGKSDDKGNKGNIFPYLLSLISGAAPAAKVFKDGLNRLCEDGDCANEVGNAVQEIKRVQGYAQGGNLGIAAYDIEGNIGSY